MAPPLALMAAAHMWDILTIKLVSLANGKLIQPELIAVHFHSC